MINNKCNLQCTYCFASTEMGLTCDTVNMTDKDFDKVIEFHKKNNITHFRIIGGEPTLHPYFIHFLNKIIKDDFFMGLHFFSNMTFSEEIRDNIILLAQEKRITILPNFNAKPISGKLFEKIKENIKELSKHRICTSVGVNFYKKDMDIDYLFELIDECECMENVRWSITTPNFTVERDFDIKGYFNQFYDLLIKFFKYCVDRNLSNNLDCNTIPMCAFTPEQTMKLIEYKPDLFAKNHCSVVTDISPDLEVFRCFGMSDHHHQTLDIEQPIEELRNDLAENTSQYYNNLLVEDCKDCGIYKINGRACSCVLYRIKRGD